MVKLSLLIARCVTAANALTLARGFEFGRERGEPCNDAKAYSILKSCPTGSAFCSSLLYPYGHNRRTETTTTTRTVTDKTCTTRTNTKLVDGTFTTTVYGASVTLPTITKTEYSHTVRIPSGSTRPVNRRAVTAAADNYARDATPKGLSTCAPNTISCACSSLVPEVTVQTHTATRTAHCTATKVVTKTTKIRTVTKTIPFDISPPPIIISTSATLTTTVPADCAGHAYFPGGDGVGDIIQPVQYPYFAQTKVECCLVCAHYTNCVASAFIQSGLDCQLLLRVNGTDADVSDICPLGVEDYPFGSPDTSGNVYPGPCGR